MTRREALADYEKSCDMGYDEACEALKKLTGTQ
jgi:TPR repeat protein